MTIICKYLKPYYEVVSFLGLLAVKSEYFIADVNYNNPITITIKNKDYNYCNYK